MSAASRQDVVTLDMTGDGTVPALPRTPPPLVMSPALAYRVHDLMRSYTLEDAHATDALCVEAAKLLGKAVKAARPAHADDIRAWVKFVALGCANPPTPLMFEARLRVIMNTSGDLPGACWTEETRKAFGQRIADGAQFFPSDNEVDRFLRPMGSKLRRQAEALRMLADHGTRRAMRLKHEPKEPTLADMSKAERDGLFAKLRASLAPKEPVPVHMQFAAVGGDPRQRDSIGQARRVSDPLKGRALWETRNKRLTEAGFPPLPEPASFEGYGAGL